MSQLHPLVQAQLGELRQMFTGAGVTPLPDGTALVVLPNLPLVSGWNQERTTAWFLVPVGYPIAKPDCFFGDSGLRLANGQMPQNTGVQALPGTGGTEHLWFSWHLQTWDAHRDSLGTFARAIRDRLGRAL